MKAAANFKIEGEIPISSDLKYKFWAKGIDGYDLPKAELSLAQGTVYPVNSTTEAFDSIKFYADDKIFKFEWFMQRAKEGSLETKITETKNDMYVIKADPATPLRQETLYHIACKHLHGIDGGDGKIIDAIYSEFFGAQLNNRAGEPLYYWRDGYDTPLNFDTTSLLKDNDGRCGAWACFFRDCVLLHNINQLKVIGVESLRGKEYLLIKNYNTKNENNVTSSKMYNFLIYVRDILNNSLIEPVNDVGFSPMAWNSTGIKGQNNPNPVSLFSDHALIRSFKDGNYYDPSYGVNKYISLNNWEKEAIWGYSNEQITRARKQEENNLIEN